MKLTASQQKATEARGNVLVMAGAGTGKTKTLVERCLHCLLEEKPEVSLEQILMVTFTDAAAAEMRQRIRARIEEKMAEKPGELRWPEQLALFETAHIGTLHSFCLKLLQQHFYQLELDPQLAVMAEDESHLLADETLGKALEAHYEKKSEFAEAVLELIQAQGRGTDLPVRELVLRLHHYTQTLHDPEGWFAAQLAMFDNREPEQWRVWLEQGVREWRRDWVESLAGMGAENKAASRCAAVLKGLPGDANREAQAAALHEIRLAEEEIPRGKKSEWGKPLKGFFEEARFLESVSPVKAGGDPLAEDWNWVRGQMTALIRLAREFAERFSEAKRELGVVDFHDLEQHALRLLWNRETKQPTEIALEWRERLRFVFVDEYQDINDAQDAILKALSREGAAANRFLVGDVKQSIYGFRLANPRIFQGYADKWQDGRGTTIPLVDNFRSREGILKFVNGLFGILMDGTGGNRPYDETAQLRFGDAKNRAALGLTADPSARVELLLRSSGGDEGDGAENGESEWNRLEEAGKEARLAALRLRELKNAGHQIWDEALGAMRAVEWGDMAVLLRSPSGKAESFAREFAQAGVPLLVARSGFYESTEVADLLSLLKVLDNPLQDLPALAVLRSPLVGMTLEELAVMRLAKKDEPVWTALKEYHEQNREDSGWAKADRFLKNVAGWRRTVRQASLSSCLEGVLDATHYADWLLTQPRGEQRRANVRRLLGLAKQFDRFQRHGLFRFLKFVEAQQEAEAGPEVAAVSGENSVSLMSIHHSKGLEFPVVVVADLGKAVNLSELQADLVLDEEYGVCPQIKPPHSGRRYPSLPFWLARRRQKQEALSEELRLLYVAMTRARDTLILSGTVSAKKFAARWQKEETQGGNWVMSARNYLDWLGGWAGETGAFPESPEGQNEWWRWKVYDDLDGQLLDAAAQATSARAQAGTVELDEKEWRKLHERLAWKYPQAMATEVSAKTSVTAARRKLAEDNEAKEWFESEVQRSLQTGPGKRKARKGGLSATEVGAAHHAFLQWMMLEEAGSEEGLRQEGRRLKEAGVLSAEELACLDFEALGKFWQSDLGKRIRAHTKDVRRELEFTARFAPGEIATDAGGLEGEYVVVQGAADLAVLLPGEIWLVDFKTDQIAASELPRRTREYEVQLRLYGEALSRIYRRPVTEAWLHFLTLNQSLRVEMKPHGQIPASK